MAVIGAIRRGVLLAWLLVIAAVVVPVVVRMAGPTVSQLPEENSARPLA